MACSMTAARSGPAARSGRASAAPARTAELPSRSRVDVVAAGLEVELHPVDDHRMADQVEQLLLEVEQDGVADQVAVRVDGDELLGPFDPKFANVFTPRSLSSRSASGPAMNRSVMWWDWSSSAHVRAHARCSDRQFVNSGAIGNVWAGVAAFRSRSTGFPTREIAAARLSGGTTQTVGKRAPPLIARMTASTWRSVPGANQDR